MRSDAAATPPRQVDAGQHVTNLYEQVLLWLTKLRDQVVLELLDMLEPRGSLRE